MSALSAAQARPRRENAMSGVQRFAFYSPPATSSRHVVGAEAPSSVPEEQLRAHQNNRNHNVGFACQRRAVVAVAVLAFYDNGGAWAWRRC